MKQFDIKKDGVDLFLYNKRGMLMLFLEDVEGIIEIGDNTVALKVHTEDKSISNIIMQCENEKLKKDNDKLISGISDMINELNNNIRASEQFSREHLLLVGIQSILEKLIRE